METNQWPLTAAATQLLLALPPAGIKGRQAPPVGEAFKLGLKELLQRGAFRLDVTPAPEAWRGNYVTLYPAGPVQLPDSLAALDGWLRPFTPDLIDGVIRSARRWNPQLMNQVREWFIWELSQRGLIERYQHKALGLFSQNVMRRTAAGDAWAATAWQYQQRLQALPWEVESDPGSAASAAAAAGALALMVPVSLAALAKLHRRRHHWGGGADWEDDFVYVTDDSMGFDPFSGTSDMFDSAVGGDLDSIDASGGAVDAALDSVASSVDSAVDSGVDAGGGGGDSGGGGDGGGGGDSAAAGQAARSSGR